MPSLVAVLAVALLVPGQEQGLLLLLVRQAVLRQEVDQEALLGQATVQVALCPAGPAPARCRSSLGTRRCVVQELVCPGSAPVECKPGTHQ